MPQVNQRHIEGGGSGQASAARAWKQKGASNAHRVHAVDEQSDPELDEAEDEQADPTVQLEAELEVLLTQAAKKRAQVEKARVL